MLERQFQSSLIKELKSIFPGCYVLKTDSEQIQGMPDLLVLYNNKWAALECKQSSRSKLQPNQKYRVEELNSMSFARIIFPENKETILNELQQAFGL